MRRAKAPCTTATATRCSACSSGWAARSIDMGVVRDDPAVLEAAFPGAAAEADAIITSGGVSVGEADHTKAMMQNLGDVAFWRIAMRPGRPMAVGRIGNARSLVRAAGQSRRRDGDLPGLRAPRPAAHDGLQRERPAAAAAGAQRRGHPQEGRPHRIPARLRHRRARARCKCASPATRVPAC